MLLGLGFAWFKQYPSELANKLPVGSYTHTCDMVDFEFLRDKRVLIVGGRQSAFEWAALIREKGAEEIYVTHRHATPQFTEPDWSWVQPMVRRTVEDHGWWRRSTHEEKEKIRNDFWAVGRLVLEAWLGPRVHQPNIHIHEKTTIVAGRTLADGTYDVLLDDDTTVNVHHIILATGYVPNMQNVAFLDRTTILRELQTLNGSPSAQYRISNESAEPVCNWTRCHAGFRTLFWIHRRLSRCGENHCGSSGSKQIGRDQAAKNEKIAATSDTQAFTVNCAPLRFFDESSSIHWASFFLPRDHWCSTRLLRV